MKKIKLLERILNGCNKKYSQLLKDNSLLNKKIMKLSDTLMRLNTRCVKII